MFWDILHDGVDFINKNISHLGLLFSLQLYCFIQEFSDVFSNKIDYYSNPLKNKSPFYMTTSWVWSVLQCENVSNISLIVAYSYFEKKILLTIHLKCCSSNVEQVNKFSFVRFRLNRTKKKKKIKIKWFFYVYICNWRNTKLYEPFFIIFFLPNTNNRN